MRSTKPAGLELTNGLFRIPAEVACDKLEIVRYDDAVFSDGGDRVIETEVQRAAERFGSGGHGGAEWRNFSFDRQPISSHL